MARYEFIGKTVFFPKEGILAVGDLHLGYEKSLKSRGLELPLNQFNEMQAELEKTINNIKARYGKIQQIVFLGDIKHHFNYLASEKNEINQLINFLKKYVENENKIIFIRGNHEKNEKSERYLDYYIFKDIAFIHGNRDFFEIFDKKINLIFMGHIHPSVTLADKMSIKKEKYKCFLSGRYRKKEIIILPSFLSITEGVSANEFSDEIARGYDFSIIPQKELENFEVYIIQEIGENALDFGKLKDLNRD
jgi:putative SbcD/Mre11-related phosphoesterase